MNEGYKYLISILIASLVFAVSANGAKDLIGIEKTTSAKMEVKVISMLK